MDTVRIPVGTAVLSLAGRDKGKIYVVTAEDKFPFVHVADGRRRTLRKAKRKNCRHLKPLGSSAGCTACSSDLMIRELVNRMGRILTGED